MKYTTQQETILNTVFDTGENRSYVVEAVAGAGKTTTIFALCNKLKEIGEINPSSKLVLLMYNKELKESTTKKIKKLGLDDVVECRTLHSFAYKGVSSKEGRLPILKNEWKEISVIIDSIKRRDFARYRNVTNYRVYKVLKDYWKSSLTPISTYCATVLPNEEKIKKLDIEKDTMETLELAQATLNYMKKAHKWTHDMYLKEYAVEYTDHPYCKYIAIDEAQDINNFTAMFLRRIRYKKLYLIGDEHQRIYQFNDTVNMMAELRPVSTVLPLTYSFRLNRITCEFCNRILALKDMSYNENGGLVQPGHSDSTLPDNYTSLILFRTRNTMVKYAISNILQDPSIHVKFLGGSYNSFSNMVGEDLPWLAAMLESSGYTQAKNTFIKSFMDEKSWQNPYSKQIIEMMRDAKAEHLTLCAYIYQHKGEVDREISRCCSLYYHITEKDTNPVYLIKGFQALKDVMAGKNKSSSKVLTLSTAHSAKGLEYDYAIIARDIWNLDKIENVNLLYVAVSRAHIYCETKYVEDILADYEYLRDKYGWKATEEGLSRALKIKIQGEEDDIQELCTMSLEEIDTKYVKAENGLAKLNELYANKGVVGYYISTKSDGDFTEGYGLDKPYNLDSFEENEEPIETALLR